MIKRAGIDMEYCSEIIIDLYLFRHGKTSANEEKRYLGRTDVSLSHDGRVMLHRAKVPADTIVFSGPMKRCLETSERMFPNTRPYIIDEWTEIDFGDFEMKTAAELGSNPDYQKWIDSGGTLDFPNGESLSQFRRRTLEGFRKCLSIIASQAGGSGQRPVPGAAVLHGGNIMVIVSMLTGRDMYDFMLENGEGIRLSLSYRDGSYQLLTSKIISESIMV